MEISSVQRVTVRLRQDKAENFDVFERVTERFIALRERCASLSFGTWNLSEISTFVVLPLFSAIIALLPLHSLAADLDFSRDIRPIFSDNCFHCHGPDAEARQADLRLDSYEGMTAFVVVPGRPDESELVARIFAEDESMRMPPPESQRVLSDAEKERIRRWIADGAVFMQHWSFQPIPRIVPIPNVADVSWPRETLDYFVLSRLEKEGWSPTKPAAPLRLLRRVHLDLTGLPPPLEQLEIFAGTGRQQVDTALERAVDRLLEDPAYGEHMAVAWLDAARYADSHGYQSDQLNTQWPYRDWVIRAFNDNLPYDEFITWQLAGDLLPDASEDQVLSTAFNRLHRMTNEGGSIAEEWRVENTADRLHTFGTAVLGLTLECSRCHDHKYDPITMRDYYSLFAFFNSIDENGMYDRSDKVPSPSLLLPTPLQRSQLQSAEEQITAAERCLHTAIQQGQSRFGDWLVNTVTSDEFLWQVDVDLAGHFTFDEVGDEFSNHAKGSASGGNAAGTSRVPGVAGHALQFNGDQGVVFPDLLQIDRWDSFSLDFWMRDNTASTLPMVVLHRTYGTDVGYNGFDMMLEDGRLQARLYRIWPGNGIGIRAGAPLATGQWQHVCVTYDGSSVAQGLKLYINGTEASTKILRNRIHKSAASAAHGEGHFILGARFRDRGFQHGELDELRVYERALTPLEIAQLHDGTSLAAAIQSPASQGEKLSEFYFSAIDTLARKRRNELRDARRGQVTVEDQIQEVAVMEELPKPRATYILARGAYDAPKTAENEVQRDTFQGILPTFPPSAPRNRLGLAQWLTDPDHPLTARVLVNRVWMRFFGQGLVTTPDNFGRQGAPPENQELLDWLARDFIDHGWDIKRLCRQIVLSATYRQDSAVAAEQRRQDTENLLLAHGPSRRLSAEQIRDLALFASELLNDEIGGPPVSPYQPGDDLWRESNTMSPPYKKSTPEGLHRRSVYSVWKRTAPLPNMMAFDATTREVCTVNRSRTNTPIQALVLLNDQQFVEAARALAADVARSHTDIHSRIREAFARLTGRYPDREELELLVDTYHEQQNLFTDGGPQNHEEFIHIGETQPDADIPPADLAALTVTCQVILNLDATIYER